MRATKRCLLLAAAVTGVTFAVPQPSSLPAQGVPAAPAPQTAPAPATLRITLEEAKQRALSNNKLLNLAELNAESKAYAVRAAGRTTSPKSSGPPCTSTSTTTWGPS
jgi:hypothetical protein